MGEFLRNLIAAVPYKLTHILTDNGIQFTNRKTDKWAWAHIKTWQQNRAASSL